MINFDFPEIGQVMPLAPVRTLMPVNQCFISIFDALTCIRQAL